MWNIIGYNQDINNQNPDYKTTVENFKKWLTDHNGWKDFIKSLNCPDIDNYDIAFDYSIPVIMVKYFRIQFDIDA